MIKIPKIDEGTVSVRIGYEVRTKTGRIRRKATRRGHSFTNNFIRFLYGKMGLRGNFFIETDGTNTSSVLHGPSTYLDFANTSSADSNQGLCVGTGTNAEAVSDYNLQSKILHGTSAGRLQYSGATSSIPTTDATSTSFILTRVFSNDSGGTIVVAEIGLIYPNDGYCLFARDLLSPSVSVLDGEQLTINYTIKVTI